MLRLTIPVRLLLLPPWLLAACTPPTDRAPSVDSGTRDLTRAPAGVPRSTQPAIRHDIAPCLAYEDTVTLHGRLRREVHPGRPNYESIVDGDEPEPGFYLHLPTPACFRAATSEGARLDEDRDSVTRIQLVLDAAGYARLRPALGDTLTLHGTIFSSITGHHHAPVLLQPACRRGSPCR
jgi:Domain of unknown function (DUF4431)